MNREVFFDAMELVEDSFKEEALELMERKNNIKHMRKRSFIRSALVAAVIMCLMTVTAYAAGKMINSPAAAERVARQELSKLQEMGLLSESIELVGEASYVSELEERQEDAYWFDRIFPHRYIVRWSPAPKYLVNLEVDTAQGKIIDIGVEANADEDDKVIREMEMEVPTGPDPSVTQTITMNYYDNFDDILPEGMTVERYCSLLAEYWGFGGYELAPTEDMFYGSWDAPKGDELLRDMTEENYYITVYFQGDQKGAPMYIQLQHYPGTVVLYTGIHHLVG